MRTRRGRHGRIGRGRRAFTVALLGPDGAGKTELARRLSAELPFPAVALYMGVSLESSTRLLPTTRLLLSFRRRRGRRPVLTAGPDEEDRRDRDGARRLLLGAKDWARLIMWLSEEWYRQVLAWREQRRGRVVIFDRHFFADYYWHHVAPARGRRRSTARVHGFFLTSVYPLPDLALILDAPVDVLLARKGGATPEFLEGRRREYLRLETVLPAVRVIDADRTFDDVTAEAAALITEFHDRLGRDSR